MKTNKLAEMGVKWITRPRLNIITNGYRTAGKIEKLFDKNGLSKIKREVEIQFSPKFKIIDKEKAIKFFDSKGVGDYPEELLTREEFELELENKMVTVSYNDEYMEVLLQIKEGKDKNGLADNYVEGYRLKKIFGEPNLNQKLFTGIEKQRAKVLNDMQNSPALDIMITSLLEEYQKELRNYYNQ